MRPLACPGLLIVALLLVGCVRTESIAASTPIPSSGTGLVEIEMSGTWLVGATSPVPTMRTIGGLTLPRAGDLVLIEDGELAAVGQQSLLPTELPDPDDWAVENYVNMTTGRVGLYSVVRSLVTTGETAALSVSLGSVDPDRMVGAVSYGFVGLEQSVEERYAVLLQRVP